MLQTITKRQQIILRKVHLYGNIILFQIFLLPFSNILASPILKGDYLYICTRSGAVYCFNALTGDVVWQVSVGGQINSTPLIEDNKLYVASFDGNIYSFNASTGEEEWNYSTTSAETFSSPLVFLCSWFW